MTNLSAIVFAASVLMGSGSSMAQRPLNDLSGWHDGSCKSDPFDDKKIDCSVFAIEDSNAPNEDRGLVIVRFVGYGNTERYLVQFFSKNNPPKLRGEKIQDDLLVRIDKNPVRTYLPVKVLVSKKPSGGIYLAVMLTSDLLEEMLQGRTVSFRYMAASGGQGTASFLLVGLGESLERMALKVQSIKAVAK